MTDTLKARGPWWELSPYIRNREPFKTHGNLCGAKGPALGHNWVTGRLPEPYCPSYYRADYVVKSYNTPIAWHGEDGWTVPDVKYSATTTAHQNKVRTCLYESLSTRGSHFDV